MEEVMSESAESQALAAEQVTIPLEKYSKQGKAVLALAQEEARSFRHNYMGTEHLLLALLRSSDSQAAATLANLGVTLATTRLAVEKIIGYGEAPFEGKLKLAPRAISVLSLAVSEAGRLKQSNVGPEHILLGILREGEGVAMGILATFGADAEKVRTQLLQSMVLAGVNVPGEPAPAKSNVVACRIDQRDLDAIDALIEAGIRSTRSDAAAWLIHAGIEANKTLFEKVSGTVAEIRRLRGVVQQLVQQTEQQQEAGEEQNTARSEETRKNPGAEQAS
jgi:ATP-dependent Clp protease ATP-binding subunit ClpA